MKSHTVPCSGTGISKLNNDGFTLLIATVTTSMLLLISFVVVNVALKQILLADAGEESQHAFYAADRGLECALYWDLTDAQFQIFRQPGSSFATDTPGTIRCSEEEITSGVQAVPIGGIFVRSLIGGGDTDPTSIFMLQSPNNECAVVQVTKNVDGTTTVDSRGYNTCDTNAPRRFERGVTITY